MNDKELAPITDRLDKIIKLMLAKELMEKKTVASKVLYLNDLGFRPSEIKNLFLPEVPLKSVTSYISRAKKIAKLKVSNGRKQND